MTPAHRDRFLTVGWNNALVAALGVPILVFASVATFTAALPERSAFVWLVVLGAVY